jgi:hypothetical protein
VPVPNAPGGLADLLDRAAIADLVHGYANSIDRRDWTMYRSIFADHIDVDFFTWAGIRQRYEADAWVAAVKDTLACFDSTQHTMSNLAISLNGDEATVVAAMTARHNLVIDGRREFQILGGYYTDRMVRQPNGWKIAGCALMITWEEGDRALFEKAHALGPRSRVDVGMQGV